MKNLIIIFLIICCAQLCKSQVRTNELTSEEFNNIRVSDILKTDIEATQGNLRLMTALFGVPILTEEFEGGIENGYRNFFFNNGLSFVFSNIYSIPLDCHLESFETNRITIRDVVINVGDHISILGSNLVLNINTDGTKSIIYTQLNYDSNPIIIEFNESTGTIIKIEYIVYS